MSIINSLKSQVYQVPNHNNSPNSIQNSIQSNPSQLITSFPQQQSVMIPMSHNAVPVGINQVNHPHLFNNNHYNNINMNANINMNNNMNNTIGNIIQDTQHQPQQKQTIIIKSEASFPSNTSYSVNVDSQLAIFKLLTNQNQSSKSSLSPSRLELINNSSSSSAISTSSVKINPFRHKQYTSSDSNTNRYSKWHIR